MMDDEEFLKEYDVSKFERPSVTVDLVIFTIIDNDLRALFIKRGQHPFLNTWALPGGFVRMNESLEEAASRELEEETGITANDVYLEQLYTFGDPARDPRTRVITVAYFALVDSEKIRPHVTGKEEIKDVKWLNAHNPPSNLAFDHGQILNYALKRLKYKLEYTAVGFELLPELFTLTDLQGIYEIILNEKIDKRNFRKKMLNTKIVEPSKKFKEGGHRPALLYRFKKSKGTLAFRKIKFEKP